MSYILHISDIHFKLLNEKRLEGEPENIIHNIREDQKNVQLILINVNYKTHNLNRSDNAGILLLKYLRLYHLQQHCVIYSFLSREQLIKQNVKNLIIFSEGVTFIRLPADLTSLNFEELAEKKAPDDLSQYFRVGFDLPEDNRHNWANWWGIERLWQVHQAVVMSKKEDFDDYQNSPFRKKMASLEALTAMYLYPINSEKLKEIQISSEIAKLESGIRACNEILRNEKIEHERTKLKDKIKNNQIKIQNLRNNVSSGEAIATLRNEITKSNRKIVLIDDQAHEGWEAIYKNMLYEIVNPINTPLKVPPNVDSNMCLEYINKSDTDIVLLDLRLKNEQGTIHDISGLSGVILFKKIIERYPGLPVVIITASNKVKSYQTIMNLGADAYWIKEGLDSRFTETETFENYKEFLEIVDKLSGREYKLLKRLSKCADHIKKHEKKFWWEYHKWTNPNSVCNIQVRDIIPVLDYSIKLYRNWLKMYILSSDDFKNDDTTKNKQLANIINTLGGIVELIHYSIRGREVVKVKSSEIGAIFGADFIELKRGDFIAFYISHMRNLGSHFYGNKSITYDLFEFFINILLSWLTFDYVSISPEHTGIRSKREFNEIVHDSNLLVEHSKQMILTQEAGVYKYQNYANFILQYYQNENITIYQ